VEFTLSYARFFAPPRMTQSEELTLTGKNHYPEGSMPRLRVIWEEIIF
jgi:hypothetical protein